MSISSTSSPSALRLREGIVGEAGGIAPGSRAITAAPVRSPQILQLLDGGGAEGVAGGQHHAMPSSRSRAASLPMVVVLPLPLTPTTRMTWGLCCGSMAQRLGHRLEDLRDLFGQRAADLLGGYFLVEARLRQIGGEARRGGRAEIGRDQQFFQLVQRRFIQLPLGEDAADARGKFRRGAAEPFPQPLKPAALRRFSGGGVVAHG